MVIDPYIDADTGILRNLLGARTAEELAYRESQIVFANEMALSTDDIAPTRDIAELALIHKKLFAEVYDWAGQFRVVDIKKNEEGAEFFLPKSKIVTACNYIFAELQKNDYLHHVDKHDFTIALADFYDKLNYIHPFREGNGRVQRLFWSRVAQNAGYRIDWSKVIGSENNEVSRLAAEQMDLSGLERMFQRIVTVSENE